MIFSDDTPEECIAYIQSLELALAKLMRFQWNDHGYGRLSCRSCGALAEQDFDERGRTLRRIDQCSPSCPWRVADTLLKQEMQK